MRLQVYLIEPDEPTQAALCDRLARCGLEAACLPSLDAGLPPSPQDHPAVLIDVDRFADPLAALGDIRSISDHSACWIVAITWSSDAERGKALLAAGADEVLPMAAEESQTAVRMQALRQRLEEGRRMREFLRRNLDTFERDREAIALRIHDGLAQQLTGALMCLEAASPRPEEAQAESFAVGLRLLRASIAECRGLVALLRPPALDEFGIVAALEQLVAEHRDSGIDIELATSAKMGRWAGPLEDAVFRIVQESLANAVRHSGSPRIRIEIRRRTQEIEASVRDWGTGFDPLRIDAATPGLQAIQQRAWLLGGFVRVDSQPGGGTTVTAKLPWVSREGYCVLG